MKPWLALLALAACSRDDLYGQSTFTDNVYKAYADCNPKAIRFLAAKQGIQLAFDECGSNRFGGFSWSPDGTRMWFELTHGGYVLDGEDKTITTVPTEAPVADAAWVRDGVLAVPLAPAEAPATEWTEDRLAAWSLDNGKPYRLAWYDEGAHTLHVFELPVRAPRDLQPAGDGQRVVFTALDDQGVRRPWFFDGLSGHVTRALEFLDGPVERLSYAPAADLVAWSDGRDAEVLRISDGGEVARIPGASRAIPHSGGRYVAIETLGEPISVFDQRAWDEISEEARRREETRRDRFVERLPEWVEAEVRPPEIQVLDLQRGERYRITAFHGDHFQWYPPTDYYCSFILWGIEGKQVHRNVALVDLADRLRLVDRGEFPAGIERVAPASDAPTPGG